ncbi:hypothetical protein SERLA73DRAFT_179618 [Serpula lacrymans var. lacrymans S7.3]|uniref:Uncharacterized protein n=2 Tax=Serpula lacrymans var. lacrymans TaxID=341189 RepID=F8PVV0_SERL3|nr:uncharacterized protein SERLADRAFT_464808 [Serpula lacrymans var. lacrymans S7.9]EGN99546.1 hypothetical protein SERLA73DRAFT_179618 [Serpula lacrymans var. lacrymans S7.3]EGO25117.1 hypothetical protein SERLADRAFT_464808 [Serpula lacrymans var. lacrymans S7.9]
MATIRLDLDTLKNQRDFIQTIQSHYPSSESSSSAVVSTLAALLQIETESQAQLTAGASSPALKFLPSRLSVLASGTHPPDAPAQEFVSRLTHAAHGAAESLTCGSIVAGHTSESDEHADVGVWLGEGDYGRGKEREVLRALGLDGWSVKQIENIELRPPLGLPSSINIATQTNAQGPEMDAFIAAFEQLEERYCFFAFGGPGSGGLIACLLLGKFKATGGHSMAGNVGWCGLVGISVAADD